MFKLCVHGVNTNGCGHCGVWPENKQYLFYIVSNCYSYAISTL